MFALINSCQPFCQILLLRLALQNTSNYQQLVHECFKVWILQFGLFQGIPLLLSTNLMAVVGWTGTRFYNLHNSLP